MNPTRKTITSPTIDFNTTAFNMVMQKRIRQVLLICSHYDAFMLEEDGRIDEQIFNEYVSLNLRYPPVFIQANSSREAFSILENQKIDLVIEMINIEDIDPFELAKKIKEKYRDIPVVVLTHFSREVSLRLQNEDLSAVDHVFCWLGNADLLLAIIKLIEDRMNAEYDVEVVGVQVILLVEDSIRYISSYLPTLYKIILKQSREFSTEALNEHQRMLRMRGRPKILMAKTLEDAVNIFNKYKFNILGIISDVSFKRTAKDAQKEVLGLDFCRMVREEDEFMPFLFQSSDAGNSKYARELKAGFIHKYSKNLLVELNEYIIRNFGFGDFVFRDPDTREEIARVSDLQELQHQIMKLPDKVLQYHTSKNDFSKWLNARAIFPIAQMFKYVRQEDFNSVDDMRSYIYESISSFRISKGRGIIASFDRQKFDEYLIFSRIGEGSIGGKARGLAFINSLIEKHRIFNQWPGVVITIPRTVVLSTDIFDEFMEMNNLYKIALSDRTDEEILQQFVKASLPKWLYQDLQAILEVIENPVAVRSSSKLEDSHYQPFAGIYSTYMIPPVKNNWKKMVNMLADAIKSVFASVYFRSSKAYMEATSNVIDEEKMGIILQEVCGRQYENRFYPALSGVARSINFYPIEPEKSSDGIANVAFGLGKYIMDGGRGLRFSPKYPKKILQLSSPEMVLKDTQKTFLALDMRPESFVPSTDDGVNLLNLPVKEAEKDSSFRFAASTFDLENNMIRDGLQYQGKRVITFSNVLIHNTFPLAEILGTLLEISQKEMNNPIEIEFAVDLDTPDDEPRLFNFLQIRPTVLNDQGLRVDLSGVKPEDTIIYSKSAMGNGTFRDLNDFIYVRPDTFNASSSEKIAGMIEQINSKFVKEKRNYILVGPGRWGSTDPWLGIPTRWAQLSAARIIVEAGLENYRIEPSQGTHFFQNVTSFGVGYFTINPYIHDGHYDVEFLASQQAVYENEYIRHIHFDTPLGVKIDGKSSIGVICKPG
ncbi:MAG: phosphoenolpyruvate synthase [Bacteroides sp. SM23_62_1]|nr:MAG: phosphoenolpyruvate synthase [Bacteroides sp. SM23_62_1]